MSLYTTGELAKKCNVSVRTIQYYDERGILVPTDLTEGGRRLFSEEDVATNVREKFGVLKYIEER